MWRCFIVPCRTAGEPMPATKAMTLAQSQHSHYIAEHFQSLDQSKTRGGA